MQGHDVLFDIENTRIGIPESNCDYNYLISGKRSKAFDPFNTRKDIAQFNAEYICRSRYCQMYIVISFCMSHIFLAFMYYFLHYKKKKSNERRCNNRLSIKSKLSEEMDILICKKGIQ